jgi:tryptophan synthase alpha chain
MNRLSTDTKNALMGHLVLGYPTLAASLDTARQYVAAGVQILELQIPFSHPTADGPVITMACQKAVEEQHVTLHDCMEALQTLRAEFPSQEIMVMSYVNRVFAYGMERFAQDMSALGIRHLIIPDLPVDSPLAERLMSAGQVQLVPVLAANAADTRLARLLARGFEFYYLMSDFKITGSGFSLHPRLEAVIAQIKTAAPQARIGIGFGVSQRAQTDAVLQVADYAIVGSALIKAQAEGHLAELLEELI